MHYVTHTTTFGQADHTYPLSRDTMDDHVVHSDIE